MPKVLIEQAALAVLADVTQAARERLGARLGASARFAIDAALAEAAQAPEYSRPQVVINMTGGVGEVVAATAEVEVNFLDYEIRPGEQDDYVVDPEGDQAWLYGEVAAPNPWNVEAILSWPTVEEVRETEEADHA